jgi:four helix bundle protein
MADFKKLEVWQKAHALAVSVNVIAGRIRGAPYVSLKSQMIRAAMSVDANIVEGRGQKSDREFARYLNIAVNSANELESHLIMALDLGAIRKTDQLALLEKLIQVRKMLHGLIGRVGSSVSSSRPTAD